MRTFLLLALLSGWMVMLTSCRGGASIESLKEYQNYVAQESNGYTKEYTVKGKKLKMTYLTPEYIAFNELKNSESRSSEDLDSLLAVNRQTRVFLLSISDAENSGKDIMYDGISSYSEYKERNLSMNFDFKEFISLHTSDSEESKYPVLASFVNTYGLGNEKQIYLVFSPDNLDGPLLHADELRVSYQDDIFHTGIHHFTFHKSQIDRPLEAGFLKKLFQS
ncbi:hypothetical protein KFE98_14405 [bacterium SCSIO 12741]|nr:hypothetical protein KFE98_14405 [bacterium SCSIO 12741]